MLFAQTATPQKTTIKPNCPFDIVGTWKSEITKGSAYFVFRSDGWVNIIGRVDYSVEVLPLDFDIIAQLNYIVDDTSHPTRIEFLTKSKSEFFPAGITTFEIVDYKDSQFVTLNHNDNSKIKWTRIPAQRYYLTLATQLGNERAGLAMISILNGRSIETTAFGFHEQNSPAFGDIPENLFEEFLLDNKSSNILFRIELTESEFNKANKLIVEWKDRIISKSTPSSSATSNASEFIKGLVDDINSCGNKLRIPTPNDDVLVYIKILKKNNTALHINDKMFPKDWKPKL